MNQDASGHAGTLALSCYGLSAADAVEVAREAERLGFDGMWLGEHALTPIGYASEHPYTNHERPITVVDPETPLLDLMVTCGAIAGATSRLFVGTGIYILPLRHPLATAVAAASLQQISGGRLLFGVGSGWLAEEFRALGQDFAARGARMDEILAVCELAWRGGQFSWEGEHFRFDPVMITATPTRIPLVFGGSSERALRRAARWGDGWHSPSSAGVEECAALRRRLRELLEEAGRGDVPFRYHVRVMDPTPRSAEEFRAAGFTDLALSTLSMWNGREVATEQKLDDLGRLAETFGRRPLAIGT